MPMLTTKDNPYSPYTDYDKWLQYDHEQGYYTQELLARVAYTDLDELDVNVERIRNESIIELIENDITDNLMIVNK